MEGTPGYPNRKLSLAAAPEEQIAYEHFNARHADASDPIRQADRRAADEARERAQPSAVVSSMAKKPEKPWTQLDRAIRAADQILQSVVSVWWSLTSLRFLQSRHFASPRQLGSDFDGPRRNAMPSSCC